MVVVSCGKAKNEQQSIEIIKSIGKQDSVFKSIIKLTNSKLLQAELEDSLAFLILPVQATCPSCRKKTIDSIVKYSSNLPRNHFIVISAKGGRKTINSYFREQDLQLPDMPGKLFLDSVDQAFRDNLYYDKPTFYYTANKRAFKKVAAIPMTVRQDLQEFFTGYRSNTN